MAAALITVSTVAAVEYGYTSTILKPHLPGKVILVDSSLKIQNVSVNFTTNSVTVQIYNSGSAAETSTLYIGVNSVTSALYSSPGQAYTVQPNAVASLTVLVPVNLTSVYTIIVTW